MKKLIILLMSLLILFISSTNMKSQCLPGWNPETKSFTIPYNGVDCHFVVYFCWTLDPMGIYHTNITGCWMEEPCGANIVQNNSSAFHEAEQEAIRQWFADHYMLPPCDGGQGGPAYFTLIVTSSNCVAIQNFGQTQTSMLIQCPGKDGICIAEYRVCADYSVHPPKPGKTLVSYYSSGNSNCPLSVTIPPNGFTFNDNWTSDCFIQSCP